MTHFSHCDPFFTLWPIFHNLAFFHTVTHFSYVGTSFTVTHFIRLRPIFPTVTNFRTGTHFQHCGPFFLTLWAKVLQCDSFFCTVIHFLHCDTLFMQWLIFHTVFLTVWPVFPYMTFRKMGHSVKNSAQCKKNASQCETLGPSGNNGSQSEKLLSVKNGSQCEKSITL